MGRNTQHEPETGGSVDIDLSLTAPDNQVVEFQVKAPDRPGERAGGKVVDGENDSHVVQAINNAAKQLRRPPSRPALIVVSAHRTWPFAWGPTAAVVHLIGSANGHGNGLTTLESNRRGRFFTEEWNHVSGVMFLDLAIGHGPDDIEDRSLYPCTVLLNPMARSPASRAWFPYARVSYLDRQVFRWANGPPEIGKTLPEGTIVLPNRQE